MSPNISMRFIVTTNNKFPSPSKKQETQKNMFYYHQILFFFVISVVSASRYDHFVVDGGHILPAKDHARMVAEMAYESLKPNVLYSIDLNYLCPFIRRGEYPDISPRAEFFYVLCITPRVHYAFYLVDDFIAIVQIQRAKSVSTPFRQELIPYLFDYYDHVFV